MDAGTGETMNSGKQVLKDSVFDPQTNENDSAGEIETAECVLLCVEGCLNGYPVKFLIYSGATDCFVSAAFVEEKGLLQNKRKHKVKINLADWTTRVEPG